MSGLNSAVVICWIVFWIYWFVAASRAKKNVRTSVSQVVRREVPIRLGIFLLAVTISLLFHSLALHIGNYYARPKGYLRRGGFIVFISGLSLAVWARRTLGKNWGMPMTIKQSPELVTTGPYHYVRHPIYSGILLALFGTAITSGLMWLFVMVLVAIYFGYSARAEERIMLTAFPQTYPDYKARTKMLIPGVL
jgi:protein-S-isoprenylcysteine O-methyltransferase Ste14